MVFPHRDRHATTSSKACARPVSGRIVFRLQIDIPLRKVLEKSLFMPQNMRSKLHYALLYYAPLHEKLHHKVSFPRASIYLGLWNLPYFGNMQNQACWKLSLRLEKRLRGVSRPENCVRKAVSRPIPSALSQIEVSYNGFPTRQDQHRSPC
jgi:hypothetical protein